MTRGDRSAEYAKRKRSPAYHTWNAMIQRCRNPKSPNYNNWGGRGIKVSERWTSFKNFLEDMGERPEGMTLDRKEVNGNYCKENCKWATYSEQNSNRRPYTHGGDVEPTEADKAKWAEQDRFFEETGVNI